MQVGAAPPSVPAVAASAGIQNAPLFVEMKESTHCVVDDFVQLFNLMWHWDFVYRFVMSLL
jgi:hypothetical protein